MPSIITAGGTTNALSRAMFARDSPIIRNAPRYLYNSTSALWSRGSKAFMPGLVFDPPATTVSPTYVTVNTSGRNLDTEAPAMRFRRRGYFSGDKVVLGFWIFGRRVGVRMTATAVDDNSSLGTVTKNITSATTEHGSADLLLSWSDAFVGGSTANDYRSIALTFEFLDTSAGSGAELYFIVPSESFATAYVPLTPEP